MAKTKKTKKEKQINEIESPSFENASILQKRYDDCEWVYQFDEDSPEIFAWTSDENDKNENPKVIFTISNIENSFISFKSNKNGKLFKIFARPISDDGKALREKQKESQKDLGNIETKIEEYESTNQEA